LLFVKVDGDINGRSEPVWWFWAARATGIKNRKFLKISYLGSGALCAQSSAPVDSGIF
jgi:hypothetical protein